MPMKTVDIPIDKLIPYERNAKIHDENQIQQIANSLLKFGWKQPVVIDKNNIIIVGHGRVEGAKIARKTNPDFDKTPCIIADDLTDEEIKAYRLADNKLNESPWDVDLLSEEMAAFTEIDMSEFGFDMDEFGGTELSDDILNSLFEDKPDDGGKEPKMIQCPHCGQMFEA